MWSQIQRKLYDLIDPNLKLQVHCAVYPGGGRTCLNGIPRFWVKLGGEVIFDCLHDYMFMWQDKTLTSATFLSKTTSPGAAALSYVTFRRLSTAS